MITQTATTSFTTELLQGIHDFSTDVFKIALYTADATLGVDTTVYTSANETSGTGYVAGGLVLTGTAVSSANGVSFVDFADAVWNPGAFTARGGLIYNSSKSNRSVAVLNFGADKTSTSTFTVQMPAASATSALIRISKGVNDGS
jgi:hypothetical protein